MKSVHASNGFSENFIQFFGTQFESPELWFEYIVKQSLETSFDATNPIVIQRNWRDY